MKTKLSDEELQKRLTRALAVGGDTHTMEDIFDAVQNDFMQCWINEDSMVITEIVRYPRVSTCDIVIAVGNLEEVMAMQDMIEEFARENGCAKLRMQGREGWKRVLPQYGWKASPRVFYELTI